MQKLNSERRGNFADRASPPALAFIVLSTVLVASGIGAGLAADAKAPTGNGRPAAQIVADINATEAAFPHYDWEGRLDPKYKQQMKQAYAGSLQRTVDLITELESASPREAAALRSDKCVFLAEMALYDDANALKTLTDLSTSAVPGDAVLGKAGLMALKWWSSADAAAQKEVVAEFQAMAKANPREDVQVGVALTMARYLAASDDVANALRDVVEEDLKGPAAIKYQKQAMKFGRTFKLTVKSTNGPMVSISDWKGKVVLIDFWATWCPPCRASVPGLIKLYQDNHAKGLEVLGISNDSSLPALKQFITENPGMVWPESFNPAGPAGWNAISPKMEVVAIPTTFIIDRDGILRDMQVGSFKEELVKKLLDQHAKPPVAAGASPLGSLTRSAVSAASNAAPPDVAPATSPAAPSDSTSEAKARSLLSLAKNYVAAKRDDLARNKLNELIKQYPDSTAAKNGKELLAKLAPQDQDQ